MADHDHASGWKDGFLFVGNDLVLDFINTHPVQNGVALELLPDFDAILRWFVAAEQVRSREAKAIKKSWGTSRQGAAVASAMRELRERLRKAVLVWQASGTVSAATTDELNRLMAEHPMRTRLTTDGEGVAAEMFFEAHRPGDLIAPLAYSAAKLFTSADRSRIRMCASCVLLFHDVSKKGTRHWCSMQLCGNRAKVAAYAARKRAIQ